MSKRKKSGVYIFAFFPINIFLRRNADLPSLMVHKNAMSWDISCPNYIEGLSGCGYFSPVLTYLSSFPHLLWSTMKPCLPLVVAHMGTQHYSLYKAMLYFLICQHLPIPGAVVTRCPDRHIQKYQIYCTWALGSDSHI